MVHDANIVGLHRDIGKGGIVSRNKKIRIGFDWGKKPSFSTVMICHGRTCHPQRDWKQCADCVEMNKEFEDDVRKAGGMKQFMRQLDQTIEKGNSSIKVMNERRK